MLSVQGIKSPLHPFNACSLTNGARGRVRTRTGCVLDAAPPLIGLHEQKNWHPLPVSHRLGFAGKTRGAALCIHERNGDMGQSVLGSASFEKSLFFARQQANPNLRNAEKVFPTSPEHFRGLIDRGAAGRPRCESAL